MTFPGFPWPRPTKSPAAPGQSSPGLVRVWVAPRRRGGWVVLVLAIAVLSGSLGLLGMSLTLGLRLMLDPEALPQGLRWVRASSQVEPPVLSLEDWRRQSEANQLSPGSPLPLGDGTLLLVPALDAAGAVVQIALFRREGQQTQAIALVPVATLPRDQVLAPWQYSGQPPAAAPAHFALTHLVPLAAAPAPTGGQWFTLEGTWPQQGLTLRYGQIFYATPQGLTLLETWSSPGGHRPQWADLDGDGPSDLIVDETLGLDPTLRGWRVLSGPDRPPHLQEVSWFQAPLDARAQMGTYHRALRLARSGLWAEAEATLVVLKADLADRWTPAAEAQLRLGSRHATLTRQQADQDWSTPTQHILALLMDARWDAALTQLEANPSLTAGVIQRLGSDQGRLWMRISAAAALPNPDPAVYAWGGLALRAQQPPTADGATPEWLARSAAPASARQRLAAILAAAQPDSTPSPAVDSDPVRAAGAARGDNLPADALGVAPTLSPIQALIGQARPIPAPRSGYAAPGQSFDAAHGQWYAVDLRGLNRGDSWQPGPWTSPQGASPEGLWTAIQPAVLADPQLLRWASPTAALPAPLTARGIAVADGRATLLATGPSPDPAALPPLVFSAGALKWLEDGGQPDPALADRTAAALFGPRTPPPALGTALATLPQHRLDLTGNGMPERLITWDAAALGHLRDWGVPVQGNAPKVVILDSDDTVIYSDLAQAQTLIALTNPAIAGSVGLLVHGASGYQLLGWDGHGFR